MRLALKLAFALAGISAMGDPSALAAGVGVLVANADRLLSATAQIFMILLKAAAAAVR